MWRRLRVWALFLAITAPARPAGAQWNAHTVGARAQRVSSPDDTRWYGWQILLADTASIAAMVAAVGTEKASLEGPAFVAYGVGSPIVHGAHGHGARALGSLGLHVAAFPLSVAAFSLGGCHDYRDAQGAEQTTCASGFTMMVGTFVVVSMIDAVALGFEPRVAPQQDRPLESPGGVELGVAVGPTRDRDGLMLGVGGRFDP